MDVVWTSSSLWASSITTKHLSAHSSICFFTIAEFISQFILLSLLSSSKTTLSSSFNWLYSLKISVKFSQVASPGWLLDHWTKTCLSLWPRTSRSLEARIHTRKSRGRLLTLASSNWGIVLGNPPLKDLSGEIWKVGCMLLFARNFKVYATCPTLAIIEKGPK